MAKNIFQKLYYKNLRKAYRAFDGVILDNKIGEIPDLQSYFEALRNKLGPETNILISYHNPIWEPVLKMASYVGLRKKLGEQNWLDQDDLKNILDISGYEVVSSYKRFFGITTITTAKVKTHDLKIKKKFSVSIIVPARNEAGNISNIIPSIPKFGLWQEVIFVEGNSTDKTWDKVKSEEIKRKNVRTFKQKGHGKADAVKLGFEKANGEILMIYDADRTVDAKDLIKFYNVLVSGLGGFANGSRLVYPMEKDAMQSLNKIGNQIMSFLFTWILGQHFKDTLCGTKAMWRKDFIKYHGDYKRYLKIDPFGDFALIFTAIKHNLKIAEIPVRYKERVYGSTNINRFRHGLLLFKMTFEAFKEFRA